MVESKTTVKHFLACAYLAAFALSSAAATLGPSQGNLIIVGGGKVGPEISSRFIELAGGPDAPIVIIPTAADGEPKMTVEDTFLFKAGAKNITFLHTRDHAVADTADFAAPIEKARAVWFDGGRQWRLVDSYLNTRTHKAILALLARGGVVGGSSAGATIQGSYLVRGAKEGNTLMMAPGYETGMALLHDSAIDQHLLTRHREKDMLQVIDAHPALLGIGLDESTAIVVHGDKFEVIGASKIAIYDAKHKPAAGEERYYFLTPGQKFDLKHRRVIP